MDSRDGKGPTHCPFSCQHLGTSATCRLGLVDLPASSKGARETGAFADCSPERTETL